MGPSSVPPPRPRSSFAAGRFDRRTIVLSALVLAAVIFGGALFVALGADDGTGGGGGTEATAPVDARPRSIPRPNEGVAPEEPGDRGGWQQLALLGVLVVAISGIAVAAFRGGARARAGRSAWAAAAATGRDGALEDRRPPTTPAAPRGPPGSP